MNLTDYFFKTSFNPNELFAAFREDANKDKVGFGLFSMSVVIQIALPIAFYFLFFEKGDAAYMGGFLTSVLLHVLTFNLLFLAIVHFSINSASDGMHADWKLVMGIVGMSSLPMIMMIIVRSFVPISDQLFFFLGAIATGVLIGVGAHVLMDIRKEAAMIVAPVLIIATTYLSGAIVRVIYQALYSLF